MNADNTNCALTTANQAHGNGGTYNLYTCGTDDFVNQVPDMGTSDIEPGKFTGTLAPSSGDFRRSRQPDHQIRSGSGVRRRHHQGVPQRTAGRPGSDRGSETQANMPSLPQRLYLQHHPGQRLSLER